MNFDDIASNLRRTGRSVVSTDDGLRRFSDVPILSRDITGGVRGIYSDLTDIKSTVDTLHDVHSNRG